MIDLDIHLGEGVRVYASIRLHLIRYGATSTIVLYLNTLGYMNQLKQDTYLYGVVHQSIPRILFNYFNEGTRDITSVSDR